MYEYYTKIERVVDGDTVDVFLDLGFKVWHKDRLRLNGIDTPEKNTPLGKALKEYLAKLIEGKIVKITVTKPDKYGRYLATVYLNSDVSINEQLISAGLAKAYHGKSKAGIWTDEELSKTIINVEIK